MLEARSMNNALRPSCLGSSLFQIKSLTGATVFTSLFRAPLSGGVPPAELMDFFPEVEGDLPREQLVLLVRHAESRWNRAQAPEHGKRETRRSHNGTAHVVGKVYLFFLDLG